MSTTGYSQAPLYTLSKQLDTASSLPMSFGLDAATRIQFKGKQYLHAYLHHSFSSTSFGTKDEAQPFFTASARQFSSFILLLGKITSPTTFEPTYGIIVKNKDVLKIALDLAVIPTQKEFRDAIKSLSR